MLKNLRRGARAAPRPPQIDFPGFDIKGVDVVVDIGCGDGLVCTYAGSRGADVVGIDIEPTLVEATSKAMADVPARSFRGIVSDADPIPLPDAFATVVVATEVLEHVDDPDRLLAEMVRIGKPGARYLISVPDPVSESLMKAAAPAWYWQKPLHIRVFGRDDLDNRCRAAGLKILDRHVSGFYWSIWWTLRFAIGMEHKYAPTPDHPALRAWDVLCDELMRTPNGAAIHQALNRLVPKSQVLILRKPASIFPALKAIRSPWSSRRV